MMFNLFKKKDDKKKPADINNPIRDMMLGDVAPMDWPKGESNDIPWSMFVQARDLITKQQNFPEAINIYKKITEMPDLESRHYLQAWHFLRRLNVNPPAELNAKVYGVLVDVHLPNGLEFVAAYADHHARYFNYTGSSVIWEAPDSSLNETIDALLGVCQQVANLLQPINVHPNPPQQVDAVQINILTPSDIRHGIGTFKQLAENPSANNIINGATYLMRTLIDKTSKK
ncbi:MAG: hypothetical protein IPP66_12325 [Anaerolineales bacterium]|nr:hypothetical protein [Anaerolineales bacterium]